MRLSKLFTLGRWFAVPALSAAIAMTIPSLSLAQPADTGDAATDDVIEEIVVTGSHIRGTPEDAELPVDVINRQDMEDIGSPSVIELVRNLSMRSKGKLGRQIL